MEGVNQTRGRSVRGYTEHDDDRALGRLLDELGPIEAEPDPDTDPEPFCEFTGPWPTGGVA